LINGYLLFVNGYWLIVIGYLDSAQYKYLVIGSGEILNAKPVCEFELGRLKIGISKIIVR